MKEQQIVEWQKLSKHERDAVFAKAAKRHKWVHALTLQNIALAKEVERLRKRVEQLERRADIHDVEHIPVRILRGRLLDPG